VHREVLEWLGMQFDALGDDLRVFEIGSRNVNGSARQAARAGQVAQWWGCDLSPGPGVDYVGPGEDAAPPWPADVVVCCEVLEHTPLTGPILANAAQRLRPGGVLLVTCATEPRRPHSAVDGGPLRHGEYYRNVLPDELRAAMTAAGLEVVDALAYLDRGDLYMAGRKC
jgi:SAM-dependent methyltransferase